MSSEKYEYSVLLSKTITLRISKEMYDKAYQKAGYGETVSDVFRKAISKYVND